MSEITARQIIESIPRRFRPEKAGDISSLLIHLNISGTEGGLFTIHVADKQCSLAPGLEGKPDCTVEASAKHYTALETGELNPQMALFTGKVKVSNLGVMMQFVKLFHRFKPESDTVELPVTIRPELNGPLKGIRVLDLSRYLPGPLAGLMLAKLGAEVIKIEPKQSPDPVRELSIDEQGQSPLYEYLNRGKKNVSIDFFQNKGKAVLLRLAEEADVLIEQFRPGVMKKLGLDFDALQKVNPGLIFVSITGYGQTGPLSMEAGHDLNYMALAGLLHREGGEPGVPEFQAADVAGGSYQAVIAVLAAVLEKKQTGKGKWLDLSMTEGVMPLNLIRSMTALTEKDAGNPGNFPLGGYLPNYNVYRCADQRYVALGALEPKFWNNFCDAVGCGDWKNRLQDSFSGNSDLLQEVKDWFLSQPSGEVLAKTKGKDCCLTLVQTPEESLKHLHFYARGTLSLDNRSWPLMPWWKPVSGNETPLWKAAQAGEDTVSVLLQVGLDRDEIARLSSEGVI